jgi:type IV secretory pathway VirB3-like protein
MVLRVIAEPPQIFWAPVLPAAVNMLLNVASMLFCIIIYNVNPIPFFITSLVGHAMIAGYALRDPHLSTLMTAWMETRRKTKNLLRVRGNKYAP